MEVWQKVFLSDADFIQSTHGQLGCVFCHGGNNQAEVKELAHTGLIADSSESICDSCHQDVAHANENNLHSTLGGFIANTEARGGNLNEGSLLSTAFENHCQDCHTTCGQCHVSRPNALGGGLVSGHEFRKTPSTQNNCVACHGSRVGAEYFGENEGVSADLHWVKANMTCTRCHGQELHGSDQSTETRYLNPDLVRCEDCHQDVVSSIDNNIQHQQHLGDLHCQACHSLPYKNCYGCHVAIDEEDLPYRTSEPSKIGFKIGYNPLQSKERPYQYAVLRHIPISSDTYRYYGADLLPGFDDLPTWKYASPHNIQLNTPQNENCNSCHGNRDIFLTEDDTDQAEWEANQGVTVDKIPELR
ncbi:hypothetical protein ACFLU1_03510 [Chloroflexota bacterium]